MLNRKSATGALFTFAGSPIHWFSRKQRHVPISSTEAELVALSATCMEVRWLQHMLEPLLRARGLPSYENIHITASRKKKKEQGTSSDMIEPTNVKVDNLSCKCIAENIAISNRTKHIEIRHFYVRELCQRKLVVVEWIPSRENLADLLTKAMPSTSTFLRLRNQIMCPPKD